MLGVFNQKLPLSLTGADAGFWGGGGGGGGCEVILKGHAPPTFALFKVTKHRIIAQPCMPNSSK